MDTIYEEDEILEYGKDEIEVIDTPGRSLGEAAAKVLQAYSFNTSALSASVQSVSSALYSSFDMSGAFSAASSVGSAISEMVNSNAALSAAAIASSAISEMTNSSAAFSAVSCASSLVSEIADSCSALSTVSCATSAIEALREQSTDIEIPSMVEAASDMSSSITVGTSGVSSLVKATSNCISETVGSALKSLSETVQRVTASIDFSGITSAMARISDLFAGIGERMAESMRSILTVTHSFFHWLIASFHGWFSNRKKNRPTPLPYNVRKAVLLCPGPRVKTLQVKFQEFAPRIRSTFLMNFRERGTSSDDEDDFLFMIAT